MRNVIRLFVIAFLIFCPALSCVSSSAMGNAIQDPSDWAYPIRQLIESDIYFREHASDRQFNLSSYLADKQILLSATANYIKPDVNKLIELLDSGDSREVNLALAAIYYYGFCGNSLSRGLLNRYNTFDNSLQRYYFYNIVICSEISSSVTDDYFDLLAIMSHEEDSSVFPQILKLLRSMPCKDGYMAWENVFIKGNGDIRVLAFTTAIFSSNRCYSVFKSGLEKSNARAFRQFQELELERKNEK